MFKRKWPWGGSIISDEGFEITVAHKSAYYHDDRGKFEFGYEGGCLSGIPYQEDKPVPLSQFETEQMIDRVVRALEFAGNRVDVFRRQ